MKNLHYREVKYRREVDGLRAVAIVPVMLLHAGFEWVSGGYVGVDVFFVISGYLITSIILREMEDGRYSILRFYERRARRILPALFFVLAMCLAVAWAWMLPDELRLFGQSLAAVQLFSSNVYFWQTANYFSPAAEELPLLHTWSLAVEEQYYLLFPLVVMICWRHGRRRLVGVTLGLVLASLAIADWGSRHYPIANFYLLPTRAWELLAGSLLSMAAPALQRVLAGRRSVAEAGALAGLAMIAVALVAFDRSTPFPSIHALLPVLGSVLIIALATPKTFVGRLLSTRPMVGIGLVSYSAYLWHQPLFVFARYTQLDLSSPLMKSGLVVGALALAVFSWRVVEQPFRERRLLASRSSLFVASAVGISVLCAAGLALEAGEGYRARGNRDALRPSANEIATVDNGWCFYSVDTIPRLTEGPKGLGCVLGDKAAPHRGLLVGDSFAGHFEPFWDLVGKRSGLAIDVVTTNWCFPSMGDRYTGPATSRAYRQCLHNRRHVAGHLGNFDFVIVSADWRNVLKQGMLDDAIGFIAEAGRNGRLVIVMPTPKRFDDDAFRRMKRASFFGEPIEISTVSLTEDSVAVEANGRVQAFAHTVPNAIFLEREQVFQVAGAPSDVSIDKITYSADGRHLSVYGSLAAAEQFVRTGDFARVRSAIDMAASRRKVTARPTDRP